MTEDFAKLLSAVRKVHYISSLYRAMHGIRAELREGWDGPTVVSYGNAVHEIEQILQRQRGVQAIDACFERTEMELEGCLAGPDKYAASRPLNVYVVLRGENGEGASVVGVRSDYEEAKILALIQPRHSRGVWKDRGENVWTNGCDYVEIEEHQVR